MTAPASTPQGVAVRRAERADLVEIARIERVSFPQPWPFGAFERFLGGSGFLVAEAEGSVVGFVVSDTVRPYGPEIGHVKDIAVHPDRRGEGIGRLLLESALSTLAAEGVGRVKLEVRETNDRAVSLYEDYGFSEHHRIPGYYDDGEDALVYVADLDGR